MSQQDIWYALIGGALIGLSTVGLMLALGRVAGLSGIMKAAMWDADRGWRIAFLVGLIGAATWYFYANPGHIQVRENFPSWLLAVAGLLVGIGVTLGNGCTSGHGICGLSRFSVRSLVATVTFFSVALLTRYVAHHVLGIAP
jgi:uncharacterized membrane protein YedE/YeeE